MSMMFHRNYLHLFRTVLSFSYNVPWLLLIGRYYGALLFDKMIFPTLQARLRDGLGDSSEWVAWGVQSAGELFLSLVFFS
jgi:hypothetical protein